MRKAKKEYFQKLIERDNNIASVWRALNVFTKGHRSTSADIPKNLTANVFNNHFLSVSESLIEPRTNVYECSNPLHDFCKQKTSGQDPFFIPYLSVSELCKYISRLEKKIVWSGWYKQPATKIVFAIHNRFAYIMFLTYALKRTFFRLSLKKPKWFRFQNHFCLFCQSFSKSMCTFT